VRSKRRHSAHSETSDRSRCDIPLRAVATKAFARGPNARIASSKSTLRADDRISIVLLIVEELFPRIGLEAFDRVPELTVLEHLGLAAERNNTNGDRRIVVPGVGSRLVDETHSLDVLELHTEAELGATTIVVLTMEKLRTRSENRKHMKIIVVLGFVENEVFRRRSI